MDWHSFFLISQTAKQNQQAQHNRVVQDSRRDRQLFKWPQEEQPPKVFSVPSPKHTCFTNKESKETTVKVNRFVSTCN